MAVQRNQNKVDIEARRARVAELMIKRLSYRDIAAMLGVSDSTIAGDVKALRRQWAKTYEDVGAIFERSAMDQDRLQSMILDAMERVAPADTPAFFGRLISLMDQRNRLHGLYPKAGAGEESDIPTGPITLQIEVIQPGNQRLVEEGGEEDAGEEDELD